MAEVGNLVVNLAAQTQQFQRDLNKANREIKSMQAQTNKRLAKMQAGFTRFKKVAGGAIAGLVGAAGFGVLTQQISQAAREIDQMNRAAQRMGTTPKSIAAVQHAFGKVNVNAQQSNDLMQELQIRLGDAANGAGPAADMIEKLGINLERVQKLPVDQQMQVVTEKLRGLETSAQRSAAASAFFSDEGVQPMLDILRQGKDVIGEARKEVELYGQAVSGAEAKAVTRMTRAWKDVQAATSGVFRQLTVQLAPALTVIAKAVSDTILPAMRSWGDTIRDFILVGLMRVVQLWNRLKFAALSSFEAIRSGWFSVINSLKSAYADFLSSVAQGASNIPGVGNGIQQAIRSNASEIRLSAARSQREVDQNSAQRIEHLRTEMERNNRAIKQATYQQIVHGAVTEDTTTQIERETKALSDQAKAANDTAKATKEASKQQDVMGMALDNVVKQFENRDKQLAKDIANPKAPSGGGKQQGPGVLQGFASAAGSRALGGDVMQLLTKPGKLANGMQMLGAAAGSAASSLFSMVMQTEPVRKAMGKLMDAIQPVIDLLGRMLAPVIQAVTRALRPILQALIPAVRALSPLFDMLASTVRSLEPLLRLIGSQLRALAPAIRVASQIFAAMLNPLHAVKKAWEGLGDLPSKVWSWLKEAFTGLVDKIWNAIKDIFGSLNPFDGGGMLSGGGGGIVDTVSNSFLGSAVGGSVGGAISSVGDSLGFAQGGVMTPNGALPLNTYAQGGIASSPQMAMFGEGRQNEAYVPLPDGRRIPAVMQTGNLEALLGQVSAKLDALISLEAESGERQTGRLSQVVEELKTISSDARLEASA